MHRYLVKTFGCQMNVHDTDRMHEILQASGYTLASRAEEADLIVLNTCSVREKAEQKLRSLVGTLAELKEGHPDLVLAVAGCMAQEHKSELIRRMKPVDLVVGPDNLPDLPALVEATRARGQPVVRTEFDLQAPAFLKAVPNSTSAPVASVYVAIMKGCDERCSFCIVPHTRGPERYRPSSEIVEEVRCWVEAGTREVILLGQTVNSYRDPTRRLGSTRDTDPGDPDESEFAALLYEIAEQVPRLERLRYTSPHPRHVTRSLVRAHQELGLLAEHVHLPVQSGSSRVLRRMIRRYTREEYLDRARSLLAARPGLSLSTDVIVGFPGETDADFQETLSLVQEVGFRGLFGFKYSPRPETASLCLGDTVPEAVKAERLAVLFELSERLLRAHLDSLVGTRQRVLVESPSKPGARTMTGRTQRNEIVHIDGSDLSTLVGVTVEVRIREAFKHSLRGELSDDSIRERTPAGRCGLVQPLRLPVLGAGSS